MGFIIEGFIGLALLLGAIWMFLFIRAKQADNAQRADETREVRLQQILHTPGERLYCVACQYAFEGPLSEDGCPMCRCGSFVVPERLRPGETAIDPTRMDVTKAAPPSPQEQREEPADVLRARQGRGPEA
jgi:hypothetical protein